MHLCVTTTVLELSGERIRGVVPGATFTIIDASGALRGEAAAGTEVLFLSPDLLDWVRGDAARGAIVAAVSSPRLAWVQTASTGVEHPLFPALLARGVRLTNAPGLHAPPIAEYVFAHLLSLAKRIPEHASLQARSEYTALPSDELGGKTFGIVGYGGIGRAAARLARVFGMRVLAVRRTAGPDELVDEMLPPDRLETLLHESDVVLLAVPLTPETHRIIDAYRLSCLRPGAVLVNVSRGAVIDEGALVAALKSGALGAAILDVQEQEPLPASSPLWRLERCIVTPHDSSRSPRTLERAVDLFLRNLRSYVDGTPLLHEIRP